MKKTIPFIVMLLIMVSCGNKKQKEPVSFDKIDITVTDQWGRIYGLQMDSIGNTKVSVGGKFAKPMEKEFIINEQIFDSISSVAKKVDIAKIDTGYNDTCKICVGYKIALVKGGKAVSTNVKNIQSNPKIADLDQLADLLYNVVRTVDKNPESLVRKENK
ncbi:MAG: hypothetical protein QM751_09830 [Paludibacteraceae bacterium]